MTRLFAGTPFDIPPKCELCGMPETECACSEQQKADAEAAAQRLKDRIAPEKQTARISIQKRKGGRKVTVVAGLTAKANDLAALLADLQTRCGTGGTVKSNDDLIELQGDHVSQTATRLKEIGFKVKR